MYGGFPGSLREEKGSIAELPFQWVAGRFADIAQETMVLEPNFDTMDWQGPARRRGACGRRAALKRSKSCDASGRMAPVEKKGDQDDRTRVHA